jgi:hypothetical protein|nr:MAG TPA: hypothetical protein [Microviridae sp.]
MLITEFEAVKKFCRDRNIPFDYSFRGSKYAAYRLKPDDCRVIRLDNDYFVMSATLYLMIRRFLVAFRKGDVSSETLFYL